MSISILHFEPVAVGCGLLLVFTVVALLVLPISLRMALLITLMFAHKQLERDRWALVRTHQWRWVRHVYQCLSIYHFAWRLDVATNNLPVPKDALKLYPSGSHILKDILETGPQTFQSKPTNRVQIESLMECVCSLVPGIVHQSGGATPLVLDVGAGKALFTRAVYEALDRKVAAVALDSRRQRDGDQFYDPPPKSRRKASTDDADETDDNNDTGDDYENDDDDAPYTRIVADVRSLSSNKNSLLPVLLRDSKGGGVISVTKHLCGGATDESLMAMCAPPLDEFVGACCLAPCCHQKIKRRAQYCNMPYLESVGFCQTHIGLRGGVQDPDLKTLGKLICMSRVDSLKSFEYRKSKLLQLLGFRRASALGRKARRLLEEGRIRYLRDHGFEDAHLVRYCDESITGDNFVIIGTKTKKRRDE
jgi:hypothetical protein